MKYNACDDEPLASDEISHAQPENRANEEPDEVHGACEGHAARRVAQHLWNFSNPVRQAVLSIKAIFSGRRGLTCDFLCAGCKGSTPRRSAEDRDILPVLEIAEAVDDLATEREGEN